MSPISRLVLAVALLSGAACSTAPTAPATANKLTPNVKPQMECVAGWDVQHGTPC